MHEMGLRILIRRCQLAASTYEKSLIPVLSVTNLHYYRVFFRVENSSKLNKLITQNTFAYYCIKCLKVNSTDNHKCVYCSSRDITQFGPLWCGQLWDADIITKMAHLNSDKSISTRLALMRGESKIDSLGFCLK